MLYFNIEMTSAGTPKVTHVVGSHQEADQNGEYVTRRDFETLGEAQQIALSAEVATGERYVATDAGPYCSPRFDVIRVPQVGDKVSYAFNGDYYPCGVIKSVSKSLKVVTTDSGKKFYRKKMTGCWKMNRTWSMVHGHIERQNPHF